MRVLFTVIALLAVFVVGCPEDDGDDDVRDDDTTAASDDDTTAGDDDSAEAAVEIKSTYPLNGAADFYHRNDIIVEFAGVVVDVGFTLVEQTSGEEVLGELVSSDVLSIHGGSKWTTMTFDPLGDGPDTSLDVSTPYTAIVEWPDHEPYSFSFQTSEIGSPLDDSEVIIGNDYAWGLSSARFSHPIWSELLGFYDEVSYPVLHVNGFDEDTGTFEAFSGPTDKQGDTYVQDFCEPTGPSVEERTGAWQNPRFELGTFNYGSYGWLWGLPDPYEFYLRGGTIEGSFTEGGDTLSGFIFRGYWDVAVFCDLLGPCEDQWDAACDGVADYGLRCVECPDDSSPYCITFEVFDIQGVRVDVVGTNPETGEQYTTLTDISHETVSDWWAGPECP